MKTKTKVKRTRAPSPNRAPRSSYAISKDKKVLHQFSTLGDLRYAKDAEGVKYITAAKFLELKKGGLAVMDRRNTEVQVKKAGTPIVVERGPEATFSTIMAAVAAGLAAGGIAGAPLRVHRIPRDAQRVAAH